MSFRILVLCRGNITRSPFIAGYLHHLYRNSDLADEIYFDIDSSGIEGRQNQPVHPEVLKRGQQLGFDLAMYRSKHSDFKAYQAADLILVADEQQYRRFRDNYPQLMEKVFKLFDFGRSETEDSVDIEDPSHRKPDVSFEDFFEIAEAETERIWNFIANVYKKSKEEGIDFSAKLFYKPPEQIDVKGKRYNLFTKRYFPICPHCQSKRIRRIKRQGFLQRKIYPKLNGYPYHCGTCGKNSILFIGTEIKSNKHSNSKRSKWEEFMEVERAKSASQPQDK